ncbi:hypothetical protein L1987_64440 [Smallanthus sonchifolius]|uniref:Uncharacterized protein n=1 Tax=Smallanthus sonchifolius TaxID=185202 RepID=A0ACB9CGA5_9ASTR|nr:hypothetical protein L1987_64440 [Smallanthus sonchifolius]
MMVKIEAHLPGGGRKNRGRAAMAEKKRRTKEIRKPLEGFEKQGKKKRRITRTVFRAVQSSFLFIIFMLSISHRFTLPRITQIPIVLLTGLTCQDAGVDQKTFLM